MNNWNFNGHIGQDAVVNILEGGATVINFSVAISEKFKNKAGKLVERTTWVSCAKFGEKTKVAEYLKKGTMVLVSGRPSVRAYQKQGGELHAQLNCTVDAIELISSKKDAVQQQAVSNVPVEQQVAAENLSEPLDDLPF